MVRVEVGKTEVRSRKAQWMRLSKFLDDYPHSDLYMVHSLTGSMKGTACLCVCVCVHWSGGVVIFLFKQN